MIRDTRLLSLDERVERQTVTGCKHESRGSERRLAYWQRRSELTDDELERRAAAVGLTLDVFQNFIANDPVNGTPAALPSGHVDERLSTELASSKLPFAKALGPYMGHLRGELQRTHVSGAIRDEIQRLTLARLHILASRTLVLKLNTARMHGELAGGSPEERFVSFLADPRVLSRCFETHPLLGRVLAATVERAISLAVELNQQLDDARPHLSLAGLIDRPDDELTELVLGLSDPHCGERCVGSLRFASGAKIAYKPKPLGVDAQFQKVLRFFNQLNVLMPLRELTVVDLGTHGFVEFIDPAPCDEIGGVRRFFFRQGMLLALLHALRGTDIHNENLIAAGEHPVLIDLECLFSTISPYMCGTDLFSLARTRAVQASVLGTALLPSYFVADGRAMEVGGLGGRGGQIFPSQVPIWEGEATDLMRVGLSDQEMPLAANLPRLEQQVVEPTKYVDDIVQGFERMYELITRHRHELVAKPELLPSFRGVFVRHLARPTWQYGVLLRDASHPDYMRSGVDRDLAFERLWKLGLTVPAGATLTETERADLWNGDVPVFRVRVADKVLISCSKRAISGFLDQSGWDEVAEAFDHRGDAERARQVSLIRTASGCMAANLDRRIDHIAPEREPLGPPQVSPTTPGSFEAAALAIAEHLVEVASLHADIPLWFGAHALPTEDWVVLPIGVDLYDGLAGIALFLGVAARHAPGRLGDVAAKACQALEDVTAQNRGPLGVGAFVGWPSLAYALVRLSHLLERPAALEAAETALKRALSEVEQSHELDVVGGAAGACIVGVRIAESRDVHSALALAAASAEKLGNAFAGGVERDPARAEAPTLTGMAHGAGGYAWALREWARVTGDAQAASLATSFVAYEDTLYDTDTNNWLDLRGATAGGRPAPMAWCHGAPGIALARIGMSPDDPHYDYAKTALEATRTRGWQPNDSLCHGVFGNIEVLLAHKLFDEAADWGAASLHRARHANQWRSGTPAAITTPGLMLGNAGIGYQLLRLANPSLPSVLLFELDGPPSAGSEAAVP